MLTVNLKTTILAAVLAASISLALASSQAHAQDANSVAQKNNCMACHAIDKKLVGPAFKDVEARYKSKPNAEAAVAKSIRMGSTGNWGGMPMPPNAGLNADQATQLAKWILSR